MGRGLSPCEMKVLGYLTQGYTNEQIGEALHITPQTVKNHVTQILRKLNAKSRTHAVSIALKNGVIGQATATADPEKIATSEHHLSEGGSLSCFCGGNKWLVVKDGYLKCDQCGQLIKLVHSVEDISLGGN